MNPPNPAIGFYAWLSRALALFAVAAGIVTFCAWPIVRAYDAGRIDVIEAREKGYVDAALLESRSLLREVVGDLRVAANLPALRQFLGDGGQDRYDTLAGVLQITMDAYGRYERITLVDANGSPVMRVDAGRGGRAIVAPRDRLSSGPSLTDIREVLRDDRIVVADVPRAEPGSGPQAQRLLRFIAPALDGDGARAGALVFDVRAATLAEGISRIMQAEPAHSVTLFDMAGRRLDDREPDPSGVPGRGEPALAPAAAEDWAAIVANEHGSIRSAAGLLVHATLHLQDEVSARPASKQAAPREDNGVAGSAWKIVSFIPQPALERRSLLNLPLGRALFALVYLLLLGLSLLLAYVSLHVQRTRQNEQIAAREMEDLYERAPCGYHSLDRNGRIVRMNQTELGWLGYGADEVVGRKHMADLMSEESRGVFARAFPAFVRSGRVNDLALSLVRKDGSLLPVLVNATAVFDDAGSFVMSRSTVVDATERRKLEAELQSQANTDMLTGIGNRRLFFQLAERELSRSRRSRSPLSLLLLDLDEFKAINDAHGHEAGDAVLRTFAASCAALLRDIDIFCRLGGEEFVLLLPGTDSAQAQAIAERLRAQAGALRVVRATPGAPVLAFTVSIGVATLRPDDAADGIDSMLRRADTALYCAKHDGRNRVRISCA